MANETLEERVSTLEEKVAALMAVEHDTLSYSTEQIEAFFALLDAANIRRGTETITLSSTAIYAYADIPVANRTTATRVIASVRRNAPPDPHYANLCLQIRRNGSTDSSGFIAQIALGTMTGSPSTEELPKGTYYIDWIAFEEA